MKKLLWFFVLVILLILFGILGYAYIENWNIFDSFYMTVITLTTTGFREVYPLSIEGRVFTIVLLILGLSFLGIFVAIITRMITDGELKLILGRRKLEKQISSLKKHVIVCGFGRMGRHIAKGFRDMGQDVLVVDIDDKVCEDLFSNGYKYLKGDARSQEILINAGINKAKALIAAMSDDANNLFVTLTARTLNKDIKIISSIVEDENRCKFEQVGVNKLVSPYYLSSSKVVNSVLNPAVEDFLEITSLKSNIEIQLTELKVEKSSALIGKNIIQSKMREEFGVMVVGLKKQNGVLSFPPDPTIKIDINDSLIIVGKKENVEKLISSNNN